MLRVDGVKEALEELASDTKTVSLLNMFAKQAYKLYELDPCADIMDKDLITPLVDALLHVFECQYSECFGPASFSLTEGYPRLHRNRNMIFSLGTCNQHPHYEENSSGEVDRLFGVVAFNVPTFNSTVNEVPSQVRATVVLNTSACPDWHDGRQVNPDRCEEFTPAVIKEDVIHHGVSSGHPEYVRIALHQAFDSESEQHFYFSHLWSCNSKIPAVAAACRRQP